MANIIFSIIEYHIHIVKTECIMLDINSFHARSNQILASYCLHCLICNRNLFHSEKDGQYA